MKKLIILFTVLLPVIALSQKSFQELVNEYEKECSEIVSDTILQSGYIEYELVPVIDVNGKISHYALGNPDTTWVKCDCPEYKDGNDRVYITGSGAYGISSSWSTDLINDHLTLEYDSHIPGTTKQEKQRVNITRDYVCEVKKRRVKPFSNHFWNWIKKQ